MSMDFVGMLREWEGNNKSWYDAHMAEALDSIGLRISEAPLRLTMRMRYYIMHI